MGNDIVTDITTGISGGLGFGDKGTGGIVPGGFVPGTPGGPPALTLTGIEDAIKGGFNVVKNIFIDIEKGVITTANIIESLFKVIVEIFKMTPQFIELIELVIEGLVKGVDFAEDMLVILPLILIFYGLTFIIDKFENGF